MWWSGTFQNISYFFLLGSFWIYLLTSFEVPSSHFEQKKKKMWIKVKCFSPRQRPCKSHREAAGTFRGATIKEAFVMRKTPTAQARWADLPSWPTLARTCSKKSASGVGSHMEQGWATIAKLLIQEENKTCECFQSLNHVGGFMQQQITRILKSGQWKWMKVIGHFHVDDVNCQRVKHSFLS